MVASACRKDPDVSFSPAPADTVIGSFSQPEIVDQSVVVNPSGGAPLTALIRLETSVPTRAALWIAGKNGPSSDVVHAFDSVATHHELPVLGLYIHYDNTVQLTLYNAAGAYLGSSAIVIKTFAGDPYLPDIRIDYSSGGKMPGMTMVGYIAEYIPFVFDEFGDIRWYLKYPDSSVLSPLKLDVGIDRLRNGNFFFANRYTDIIYEIDVLGNILDSWSFPGYRFHHHVMEKPNGNFLVTVSKTGLATVEDHLIEIDRITKQVVAVWDFRSSLQPGRKTLISDSVDWIHVNAVEYDESDQCVIISGRHQGVVKLTPNNQVVWILAPHKGWGLAGDGTDLTTKLLTPLDAGNQPITDTAVLSGFSNHPDFEWNWYQHATKLNPKGTLTLFDNGYRRNYTQTSFYSRAVEYEIDEGNMTVRQVWQYGKNRGTDTYSDIVSDVDYLPGANRVVFSPGAVENPLKYGKVVEVDYLSSTVYFEATIIPPASYPRHPTFHRTQRLTLYP